jgi:hypothetical protein
MYAQIYHVLPDLPIGRITHGDNGCIRMSGVLGALKVREPWHMIFFTQHPGLFLGAAPDTDEIHLICQNE